MSKMASSDEGAVAPVFLRRLADDAGLRSMRAIGQDPEPGQAAHVAIV
jgi:hypothetical protein